MSIQNPNVFVRNFDELNNFKNNVKKGMVYSEQDTASKTLKYTNIDSAYVIIRIDVTNAGKTSFGIYQKSYNTDKMPKLINISDNSFVGNRFTLDKVGSYIFYADIVTLYP